MVDEVSTPLDLTNLDSACLAVRQARPDKPRLLLTEQTPTGLNLINLDFAIQTTST